VSGREEQETVWPASLMGWASEPFIRFLRIEALAAALLLSCALIALILANSVWADPFLSFWQISIGLQLGSFDFARSLQHWINDGLMTLFFFVVSLELKRELVLGELRDRKAATLPLIAAIGGMVVPALIYILLLGQHEGGTGWGVVMATDTAFVIGSLALFGSSIPPSLRILLVALAVFDDVGSIAVVAIVYAETLNPVAVGSAILAIGLTSLCARAGIRSLAVYVGLGVFLWLALDASGIHATLAGVILGVMTPARAWVGDERLRRILDKLLAYPEGEHWSGNTQDRRDLKNAGRAVSEALSPLERLEIALHPWIAFTILPLFALANAGVTLSLGELDGLIVVAIVSGLAFGKPLGILLFIWMALRLRVATLSADLNWRFLMGGAFLSGIGFTMSLFIAELAFAESLTSSAKAGVFAGSAVAASFGLALLAFAASQRRPISPD